MTSITLMKEGGGFDASAPIAPSVIPVRLNFRLPEREVCEICYFITFSEF